VQYQDATRSARRRDLSAETLKLLDERIAAIIEEQRARAEAIIRERKPLVEALRDLLLEKKTLDRTALAAFTKAK
jgi:cell division protease FtsH